MGIAVKDEEIDEALQKASPVPHDLEAALLKRIAGSIRPSLRPVRPLPSNWLLTGALLLVCVAVALAGAARTGFFGIEKLSTWDRSLIFSTLSVLAWMAGRELVAQFIPGSRHRLTAGVFLTITTVALLGIFALLFRDYRTDHFISLGIACLLAGLLVAIPAAFLSWLLLRRGYAVNPLAAGLAAGTLGGLSGVMMLELQCPNFQALHVLAWHTAVVPVSAVAGTLVGWVLMRYGQRANDRAGF
jgi:hypothetical protein